MKRKLDRMIEEERSQLDLLVIALSGVLLIKNLTSFGSSSSLALNLSIGYQSIFFFGFSARKRTRSLVV